jgi:hypothetical protein
MVRRVNWVTRETEQERERWRASRRVNARFYMRSNPGYVQGHGLVTMIPMDGPILLRALSNFLVGRAGRVSRILFGTAAPQPDAPSTQMPLTPPIAKPRPRPSDFASLDFQPSRH